jgi:hypothetical protein
LRERADGHFSFDETGRWDSAFHELRLVQNKTLLPKCKQTEKAGDVAQRYQLRCLSPKRSFRSVQFNLGLSGWYNFDIVNDVTASTRETHYMF